MTGQQHGGPITPIVFGQKGANTPLHGHVEPNRRLVEKDDARAVEAAEIAEEYRRRMREGAHRGLYLAASIVTLLMDLLFPTVTRTILQIFRCRKLGDAAQGGGFYLEADYSIRCYSDEWREYVVLAGCAVAVYCIGIPLGFFAAIRYYKRRGRLGDANVDRVIGWMHRPYREGHEAWISVELLRKLILTACIGFMARTCHYKLLMAQLVSFAFILLFFSVSPYRSRRHHWLQVVAMIIPALGMSWALVGRAESAEAADKGGTGYDVYGLVFVHSMLVVPLACVALFTLAATCWLLLKGLLHASADALAYAAHQAAALAAASAERERQRGGGGGEKVAEEEEEDKQA